MTLLRITVPTVGTAAGNVPSVPIPITSMNFTLSGQFTMVNSTLGISSSAFATTVQGVLATSALQPGAAGLMTLDTGWTANSTAGNKTAILAAYTNGLDGTMVAALNVVSSGVGTALNTGLASVALLVQKVAAIETALVASKLPNA